MDSRTYGSSQIEDTGGKHLEYVTKTLSAYVTGLVGILIILSVLLPVTSCSQQNNSEITLEELISDPVRYNGEEITVEGFYFQGFEVQVIAERLEYSGYAEGHIVPKGKMVWIEGEIPVEVYEALYQQSMMGPNELYGKVKITGQFEYGGKYGHLGGYEYKIVPSMVELLDWSP